MMVTEIQKREIEELAKDHSVALLAFGADLYKQGVSRGIKLTVFCASLVFAMFEITRYYKNKYEEKAPE